jgi:hypothetical protein
MIYKMLPKIGDNQIYARIDDDNICRVTCNDQDLDFIKWISEGNTPLPAENE